MYAAGDAGAQTDTGWDDDWLSSWNVVIEVAEFEQRRRQSPWTSDYLTAWDIIRFHKLRGRYAIGRAFPFASYRQAVETHRKWVCGLPPEAYRDYMKRIRDEQHFLYRRPLPSDD